MDIDYKILWFEDTDEPYDTLSRRTKRYVEQKIFAAQLTELVELQLLTSLSMILIHMMCWLLIFNLQKEVRAMT